MEKLPGDIVAGLRKILLVEDNLELRNLYETYLKANGYEISTAGDGEEGIKVAKEYQPELIFLDVMMPKMDGFQVLKILRHDPSYGCTKTKEKVVLGIFEILLLILVAVLVLGGSGKLSDKT
jgi:CheY-like chemotaxis protein